MKSYTKKDVSYTERPFFIGGKNMPYRPKKPCRHPGCANLTDGRYCEEHISCHPEVTRSATKRGYGSKWRTSSKAYLREHPLCEICKRNGKYVQATVVDHIKPHRGDNKLFWDKSNWQSLCKSCHDKKTGKEDSQPTYRYVKK